MQIESWVLVAAGVSLFLCVISFIYERFNVATRLTTIGKIGGAIGSVALTVFAIVFAAAMGRLDTMASVFAANPLSFMMSTATGGDYTGECVVPGNDKSCAIYCCEAFDDPTNKWRDCDEHCRSKVGTVGNNTGSTCKLDQTRSAYCDVSKLAKTTNDGGQCNSDETKGPITCTCCRSMTTVPLYWWDCDTGCNSFLGLSGIDLKDKSMCADATNYKCATEVAQTADTITNNQNNAQSF